MVIVLIVLGVVLGIALIIGLWVMGIYNGLVRLRQAVRNAWSQIDVQLKRRHDLIPNLVNTVKGYATHEKTTLDAVISARAKATSVNVTATTAERMKAEGELSSALSRLLMVTENYPALKADKQFIMLQEELTSTENRVAFARQHYNDNASQHNVAVQTFPAVLIAGMLGFKEEPFFEAPAEAKNVPTVQF